MKRKTVQKESKSLKTFYLYSLLVFLLIGISLFIKLIFVIQSSKFDGNHHFTVVVTKEQRVKEIIAFSPQIPSLAVLRVKDENVPYSSLGINHGISSDVQLEVNKTEILQQDVTTTMWNAVRNYNAIRTDATIIDYIRLSLLSREIISNNRVIRDITLNDDNAANDTLIARALNDPSISSESVSIKIINASTVSGNAQRLGRVLANMGANVVEVSTSRNVQDKSKIQYFGERLYTNEKIEQYLGYPVSELNKQEIADIVIILGEDTKNTKKF
jgi:hypothetical protein